MQNIPNGKEKYISYRPEVPSSVNAACENNHKVEEAVYCYPWAR